MNDPADEEIDQIIEYELNANYEEIDAKDVIQEQCTADEELHEKHGIIMMVDQGQPLDEVPAKSNKTPAELPHNGPRRFLLYDSLIAEIVDFDESDGAPIVEFSMPLDEREEEKLPVECGICPDVMHKSRLERHIKTHLKPGTKRYVCIYCEESFVSRAYAAGHSRRHMGIRPYVCAPCKLYYCTKQDLKVHQQRRHLAKDHICELCGKTFAQNTSLKNHRTLVHEQQRRFECEHCGKRFLRNYGMKEHIRNVHYGDRRLLDCPFCDMRFKDTHKLARHRKEMHLHQSMFECRACGLEFTSIDFFDAHRRSLQCRKKLKEFDTNVDSEHNLQETVSEQQPQEEEDEVLQQHDGEQHYIEQLVEEVVDEAEQLELLKKEQEILNQLTADNL